MTTARRRDQQIGACSGHVVSLDGRPCRGCGTPITTGTWWYCCNMFRAVDGRLPAWADRDARWCEACAQGVQQLGVMAT